VAAPNTFAGADLDRVSWRRTDAAWLAGARADPKARALVSVAGELAVTGDPGEAPADVWDPPTDGAAAPLVVGLGDVAPLVVGLGDVAPLDGTEPVLLGLRAGVPLFAIEAAALPDGARGASLRELAPLVTSAESGAIAFAVAMGNWHRRHRFCSNCGAPSEVGEAGFVRTCPACGAQHHPRTDPVVIMLVIDGDRTLMGRQAVWPEGRYSCLAGFVEPGESLEEAVAREIHEESGVEIDDIRYRSSQPWPFPASLMLGFTSRYVRGEAHARDGELQDVRWLDRDALRAGAVLLPPPLSIARRLIDDWLAEG
jgi:NAD+ diphosphatase